MMGWVLALSASGSVQAGEASITASAPVVVEHAWIRPAPPSAPVRAGYGVLENRGEAEVVIDAVRSDAFGAIEMHEMHDVDGVMRMRRLPLLTVPAGGSVTLAPGGAHLMLFRPALALAEGETATIVFISAGKEVARAAFVVRAPQ